MADVDKTMAHTTQDIWQQINQQAASIGEIRSAQASTDTRLDSIERSVESGFHSITTELQRISGRVYAPPKEVSTTAIIGAAAAVIFGVLGMFGAYTMLITAPIKANVVAMQQDIRARDAIISDYYGSRAVLHHTVEDVKDLEKFKEVAARNHGELNSSLGVLSERVADIDNYGSRVWNSVKKREE